MKKKKLWSSFLAVSLTVGMLAGCGQAQTPAPESAASEMAQEVSESAAETSEAAVGATEVDAEVSGQMEESAAEASGELAESTIETGGGSPWIDSDLKENIVADMALDPREDFHLYVNHHWLVNQDIPEGYSSAGPFLDVSLDTLEKAKTVLQDESLTGHDAQLVQDLYHAYLDWDARNALGVEPILPTVQDIQSIKNLEGLSDFICDKERSYGVPTFAGFGNTTDFNDATMNITCLGNDGFLLGDAAEYGERTLYGQLEEQANRLGAVAMLKRVGFSEEEGQRMFDEVLEFEAELAQVAFTSADSMAPDFLEKINNVMSPEEMFALAPDFPLERFLVSQGYDDAKEFLVMQPRYFVRLNELYVEENVEAIKNYMLVCYVLGQMSKLDQEAFSLTIEMSNMTSGATGRLEDEEYAFEIIKSSLKDSFERLYLQKYDASETKERITELCNEVIDFYRQQLKETQWLSEKTRQAAIEKLDHITVNAVYPDKRYDYSQLSLDGLSYWECRKALSDFYIARDQEKTNQKVDRELWDFSILETNAYYNPQDNSINILLGILGGDFYQEGMSEEELYAGIGSVIGHEISHAFDTSGAQFDAYGNMENWWTDEDYAAFTERAGRLSEYYNNITVFGDHQVMGQNIQGEAIADMAGMKSMIAIAKEKPGFDYDRFFQHYAEIWRRLSRYEYEYACLTQDTHPLHYLRTNVTLQQFDEFLETYDIKEGDAMYLAPEDRIAVW